MLLNFKVKNFRSIKDEIILDLQATKDTTLKSQAVFEKGNVSLLKSAAIYGPNASGKSNILKAFVVFRRMILESLLRSIATEDLPSEYFKLSSATEKKPSFFEMEFLLEEEVFIYGFEIDRKKICAEWLRQKKGNKTLFKRNEQVIESNKNYFPEATMVLKKQTGERVLFLSVLASNNGQISKRIIRFIQEINYILGAKRNSTLDFSFEQISNNPKIAKKMKGFILKADFGVVDIKTREEMILAKQARGIPDKFKETFKHDYEIIVRGIKDDDEITVRSIDFLHEKYDKNEMSIGSELFNFFAEESDGTQQMFALSGPLFDALEGGKVLFIDEIEASLHPILCQYLVSIFNSKERNANNAQLVFTTHNMSLLSEEFLRRDQIYFTEKNKMGATDLFSLSDISERKGVDFAKRYLEGRYDALPYIADFESLKFSR